jgi:transcriptional regulator with PAS, ATPase and Fis domain
MTDPFTTIVHRCAEMRSLVSRARQVAQDPGDVLIEGESGTGKELLARTLHVASARSGHPFVAIRCGAMPETLLEPEIFGRVKGGIAIRTPILYPGLLIRASGGTVLLEDVCELPLVLQTRLLDALESRSATPFGSRKQQSIDVRVVATSIRRVDTEIDTGRFSRALRDRIARHVFWMPPLRERIGDVEPLVEHFLNGPSECLSPDAGMKLASGVMHRLQSHHWPGNVCQLKLLLEEAKFRAESRPAVNLIYLHLPSDGE